MEYNTIMAMPPDEFFEKLKECFAEAAFPAGCSCAGYHDFSGKAEASGKCGGEGYS